MQARQSRHPHGEHFTHLDRRSCRGMMYRSLLELPTKEVSFRSRPTLASICGMVVDQAFRLPRTFFAAEFVTRRNRPDVARAAVTTPQRPCFFSEGSENL